MALVAIGMLVVPRAPAGAEAPSAHGYWWRLQSGVGPRLTPPGVPEEGLWVTVDPSGDQAVSALRIEPPAGSSVASLQLRATEVVGTPTVVACPATSPWEPADAGSWEERPDAGCDTLLVEATFDGDVLSVPLAAFGDGPVDLVLVPDAASQGFFSISFEPPDRDTFALATATAETPAAPPVTRPAGAPVPTVAPRPEPTTYEAPPAAFATPPFAPPPPVTTAAQPESGEQEPATADPGPSDATETALPVASTTGARQPLAAVALLIVAAGWAYRGRAALRGAPSHPLAAGNVAFARHDQEGAG